MRELKPEGFKIEYQRQIEDRNYDKLSFNEKIYNLLEAQDTFQHNRKIQMNFRIFQSCSVRMFSDTVFEWSDIYNSYVLFIQNIAKCHSFKVILFFRI